MFVSILPERISIKFGTCIEHGRTHILCFFAQTMSRSILKLRKLLAFAIIKKKK